MRNKEIRRGFTKIIAAFSASMVLVWLVFYLSVFANNGRIMSESVNMATDNLLAELNDEFSSMTEAAFVIASSSTVQDFLAEENTRLFYKKAESAAEVIGNATYPHIDADSIIAVTEKDFFFRFSGSTDSEDITRIIAEVLNGERSAYSLAELGGVSYFCLVTPVFAGASGLQERVGHLLILSSVVKVRRTLAEVNTMSGMDAAVILDDTILISSRPELDGQAASELDRLYGQTRLARLAGTNLYAAAAVTDYALHYNERVLLITSAVTLVALLVTILLMHRILAARTINPVLERSDSMRTGLLRTQIDAHFFRNTIDCVEKFMESRDYESAAVAVNKLNLMIKDLHLAGEERNAYDETLSLEWYLEIVNLRSGGKYHVEMNLDEELTLYRIPTRVLQPLVENAIEHGLTGKGADYRLTITGSVGKDAVVFEVADNGVGLEPGKAAALQELLDSADEWSYDEHRLKGMALLNIQKRIRSAYGRGYGLAVDERPGGGFSATVRLPLIHDAGEGAGAEEKAKRSIE